MSRHQTCASVITGRATRVLSRGPDKRLYCCLFTGENYVRSRRRVRGRRKVQLLLSVVLDRRPCSRRRRMPVETARAFLVLLCSVGVHRSFAPSSFFSRFYFVFPHSPPPKTVRNSSHKRFRET